MYDVFYSTVYTLVLPPHGLSTRSTSFYSYKLYTVSAIALMLIYVLGDYSKLITRVSNNQVIHLKGCVVRTHNDIRCCYHSIMLKVPDTSAPLIIVM
jgi:hypothetical protein